MVNMLKDLLECKCKQRYSIEPHGKGYAIYWGRCQHKHGCNIALLTEIDRVDLIKYFEDSLNKGKDVANNTQEVEG